MIECNYSLYCYQASTKLCLILAGNHLEIANVSQCSCFTGYCQISEGACSKLGENGHFAKSSSNMCENITAIECADNYCIQNQICVPLDSVYFSKQSITQLCNQPTNNYQCAAGFCVDNHQLCKYFQTSSDITGKSDSHKCICKTKQRKINKKNIFCISLQHTMHSILLFSIQSDNSSAEASSVVFIECTKSFCLSEGMCVPIGSASNKIAQSTAGDFSCLSALTKHSRYCSHGYCLFDDTCVIMQPSLFGRDIDSNCLGKNK